MGIFEMMLQNETRERFAARRDTAFGETRKAKKEIREYIFSESCTNDIERLASGDFFITLPQQKAVYKHFGAKKRIIYLFRPRERILMRYMTFVLGEVYDSIFADSLYSFRTSENAISMVKRIKRIRRLEGGCKIRADLKSYFNSIDEEKLVEMTDRVFSGDPVFAGFVRWLLLRREYTVNNTVKKGHLGAIPGMPLSNFLANVYLMDMDVLFQKNCRFYARYSDDIFILTDTWEQLQACRERLEEILQEKGLQINEEKTRFLRPGESFEIMGFKVSGGEIDIADSSIVKIDRKMKRRAERILYLKRKKGFSDEEAMRRMVVAAENMLFYKDENKPELNWTMWAFPVITTTEGLKKIDAIMQKYIRYAATGTLSERNYRAKYREMQKLGYRTTVHAYYKEFLAQ